MKKYKQYPDFLHIGDQLLKWYKLNGRELPFRQTKDPYVIWVSEIIFQQTRIQQGIGYFHNFIKRFPTIDALAKSNIDDVLLYWQGLGYYSRAINLHAAAQDIQRNYNGEFPSTYEDIIKLKGIGKYTASAISSIAFSENRAAVDGNLFRVLSRFFADDFDISNTKAYDYFSELAQRLMPEGKAGDFNQAMMDLGSEICKSKLPNCICCPISIDCLGYQMNLQTEFPKKKAKVKVRQYDLEYFFIYYKKTFLIQQRGDDFIWKKLFEFPRSVLLSTYDLISKEFVVHHKLSHLQLSITFKMIELSDFKDFNFYVKDNVSVIDFEDSQKKSFPKPIQTFLKEFYEGLGDV